MSLFLQNLTATNLNVSDLAIIDTIDAFISNDSDSTNTSITAKIVHPKGLKYLFDNATSITFNTASFTTLTGNTITGSGIASSAEAKAFTETNKIITPYNLDIALKNPNIIGSNTTTDAKFTEFSATEFSGSILTSKNEANIGSIETHIMTPDTVRIALNSPTTIGSINENDAYFSNLTTTGTLTFTGLIDTDSAGTGYSSYTKGDILIGNASGSLTKLNVGTDGLLLKIDNTASEGIIWDNFTIEGNLYDGIIKLIPTDNTEAIDTNINNKGLVPSNLPSVFKNISNIGTVSANKAKFTNFTVNTLNLTTPLTIADYGTGLDTFTKGDILAGNASNTLSKIAVGANDKVLSVDSNGNLVWITPTVGAGSFPNYYYNVSSPVLNTAKTTCNFDYIVTTNNDNSALITLTNITITLANNILQSSNLTGTVSSSTITVTGSSTTFTTDFIVGDIIYSNSEGRRIVLITNDTSLQVESAFTSPLSSNTYKRGGLAKKTKYNIYCNASNIYLSTRDYSNGETLVDISGSVDNYKQLFYIIYYNLTSFYDIINTSENYPNKYLEYSDPYYVDNSKYTIDSIKGRNIIGTKNIDINIPLTLDILTIGANGVEANRTLTGTITTNGSIITGTGTSFTTELKVGDYIAITGIDYSSKVISIISNTSLIVEKSINSSNRIVDWNIGVTGSNPSYNSIITSIGTSPFNIGNSLHLLSGVSYSPYSYLYPVKLPYIVPDNWTLECWFSIANANYGDIFGCYNSHNRFHAIVTSTIMTVTIGFIGFSTDLTLSVTSNIQTWNHIAICYDSDNQSITLYYNGVVSTHATTNVVGNVQNGFFDDFCLGSNPTEMTTIRGSTHQGQILISEFRFSNIHRYQTFTSYSIPTQTFKNDSNTICLLSPYNTESLNYSITSTSNNLFSNIGANTSLPVSYTLAGSPIPTLSTTKYKFSGSSVYIGTSSDGSLTFNSFPNLNALSTWTIEIWFYNNGADGYIFGSTTIEKYLSIYKAGPGFLQIRISSSVAGTYDIYHNSAGSGLLNTYDWNHVALVCTGTTYLVCLNGIITSSISSASKIPAAQWTDGSFGLFSSTALSVSTSNDYFDEFRVSNNARYTGSQNASYTIPSSEFTVDSNTLILNHFNIPTTNLKNIQIPDSYDTNIRWIIGRYFADSKVINPSISYSTGTKKFGSKSISFGIDALSINTAGTYMYINTGYNSIPSVPDNPVVNDFPSGLTIWIDPTDSNSMQYLKIPLAHIQYYEAYGLINKVNSTVATISSISNNITLYPYYFKNGFNDKSFLRYQISGTYFKLTGGTNYSSGLTISIAVKLIVASQTNLFGTDTALGTNGIAVLVTAAGLVQYYVGSTVVAVSASYALNIKSLALITIVDSISSTNIYINGILAVSSTAQAAISGRNIPTANIGTYASGTVTTHELYELQFYNSALSNNNRAKVDKYLLSKWNIINNITSIPNSGNWTIECWFNISNLSSATCIFGSCNNGTLNKLLNIEVSSAGALTYQLSTDGINNDILNYTSGSGQVSTGTWYHIALAFDGSNYYSLFNGTLLNTASSTNYVNVHTFGPYFTIGRNLSTTRYFNGYIDDFQFSSTARYTSNYSVPASQLTSDSYTLSLNNFESVTESTNNFSILENKYSNTGLTAQNYYSTSTNIPNAIYYPYLLGDKTPCILLSLRNYNIDSNLPVTIPNGYSINNCIQLPFSLITDSSSNLYNILWEKNIATYANNPIFNFNQYSASILGSANTYNGYIDYSQYIPKNSKLALLNYLIYSTIPNSATPLTTIANTLTLGDNKYIFNNTMNGFPITTTLIDNPLQSTLYTPLDNNQKSYIIMTYNTSTSKLFIKINLMSFFITN